MRLLRVRPHSPHTLKVGFSPLNLGTTPGDADSLGEA